MAIRKYLNFSPSIAKGVFVDDTAVVIGKVSIGKDSSVWPLTAIRGDVHDIKIGECTNIQDGAVLHATSPESAGPDGFALSIGNDVTVGHRVVLHGCTIHDRVLVGMGAIVMDGSVIGPDVIIGAGSIVSPGKTLSSGGLYVGSPAKRVRNLKQSELDFLAYSAAQYVKLKNLHQSSP
ncbi:MAG: gamma carbonic anhydrase family protein [Pseudohongiellaceae bacterium]